MSTTTQATPPRAPRRRTPQREPLTMLTTVTHDRALSTPWWELFHARPDSRPGLILDVWHNVDADTWTCDEAQCAGYFHHRKCHHIDRAKRLRRVQWWHACLLGWGPDDLHARRAVYRARESDLGLTEDELCACDALSLLLGEQESSAA